MLSLTDNLYALRFLRLLTMPWEKTAAYKKEVIDRDGNRIKKNLSSSDTKVYTLFHRLVFTIRRLLQKIPIVGKSILTNYAAALLMIRETLEIKDNKEFVRILHEYLVPDMSLDELEESLLAITENQTIDELMIGEEYQINCDINLGPYGLTSKILKHGESVVILEKMENLTFFGEQPVYKARYKNTEFYLISENVTVATSTVGGVSEPIVKKDCKKQKKKKEMDNKTTYKKIKEQLRTEELALSTPENNDFQLSNYDISMSVALDMLWSEYNKRRFEFPNRDIPDEFMKALVNRIALIHNGISPEDLYAEFIEELEAEEDDSWNPADVRRELEMEDDDDEYEEGYEDGFEDGTEFDEDVTESFDKVEDFTRQMKFLDPITDKLSVIMLKKYVQALKELNNLVQSEIQSSKNKKLPNTLEFYAAKLARQHSEKLDPRKLARLYRLKLEEFDLHESDLFLTETEHKSNIYAKIKNQLQESDNANH